MAVVIDEVSVTATDPRSVDPARPARQPSRGLDVEAVRALIRRDQERRARLTVD